MIKSVKEYFLGWEILNKPNWAGSRLNTDFNCITDQKVHSFDNILL